MKTKVISKFGTTFYTLALFVSTTIGDIPRFTVEPKSGFISPGTSQMLSCDVHPHSISIRWTFNGTQVLPDSRRGIDVHEGTLRISTFNQAPVQNRLPAGAGPEEVVTHEGVYQCVATGQAGSIVSREAHLQAAVLGSFEGLRTVEELEIIEGNVAVIPCTPPHSRPAAVVEYDFNGTRIIPSARHVILTSSSTLQIADVRRGDIGLYQCAVYNSVVGHRARSPVQYRLKVKGGGTRQAPVFVRTSHSPVTAVLGRELSLECAAEGWPAPNVTWEKYGGHLPTGRYKFVLGNLIISEIQMFDAGTYLCKISNGVGSPESKVISVEVHEPPVIDASPAHQTVKEGETVTFKCKVHGSPEVTVEWYHNASPIQNRPSVTIKDTSLVLANVKSHQRGMYQCIARNYLGMTHASARLNVIESAGGQGNSLSVKPPSSSANHVPVHDFGRDSDYADELGVKDYEEYDEGSRHGGGGATRSDKIDQHGLRHGGVNQPHGQDTFYVSRPDVSKVTESSVLIKWSLITPQGSADRLGPPFVSSFTLQYREVGGGPSIQAGSAWRTLIQDIPASLRMYELTRITAGSYRFRLVAVLANGSMRYGPTSQRVTVGVKQQNRIALPAPIIVEMRPLTVSEIFIGWQQLDTEQWPIDGFYIYYAPYSDVTSADENGNKNQGAGATSVGALVGEEQRKMVQGASVRHAILSQLRAGVQYRVRMQSYSAMLGESEHSNIVFKRTLGSADESPPAYAAAASHTTRDQGGTGFVDSDPGRSESGQIYAQDVLNQKPENQFLYIALGTVLSVVVLVTVLCITMCMWKQHKRQQFGGTVKERQALPCNIGGSIGGVNPYSGGAISPKAANLINSMLMRSSHPTPSSTNSHLTTPAHIPGCPGTCSPSHPQQYGCKDQGCGGSLVSPLCAQEAALALRDNAAAYQLKTGTGTTRKQPELVLPPPPPLPLPPGYSTATDSYDPMDHLYSRLEEPTPYPPDNSTPSHTSSMLVDHLMPGSQGIIPLRKDLVTVISPSVTSLTASGHPARMSPDHIPRSHERRLLGQDGPSCLLGAQAPSRRLPVHHNPLQKVDNSQSGENERLCSRVNQGEQRYPERGWNQGADRYNDDDDDVDDDNDEADEDDNLMRDQGTITDLLSNNGAASVYTTESDSNAYSSLDGRSLQHSSLSNHMPVNRSNPSHHVPHPNPRQYYDMDRIPPSEGQEFHGSNFYNPNDRFSRSRELVQYDPVADAGYDVENDDDDDGDDDDCLGEDSSSEDRKRFAHRIRQN